MLCVGARDAVQRQIINPVSNHTSSLPVAPTPSSTTPTSTTHTTAAPNPGTYKKLNLPLHPLTSLWSVAAPSTSLQQNQQPAAVASTPTPNSPVQDTSVAPHQHSPTHQATSSSNRTLAASLDASANVPCNLPGGHEGAELRGGNRRGNPRRDGDDGCKPDESCSRGNPGRGAISDKPRERDDGRKSASGGESMSINLGHGDKPEDKGGQDSSLSTGSGNLQDDPEKSGSRDTAKPKEGGRKAGGRKDAEKPDKKIQRLATGLAANLNLTVVSWPRMQWSQRLDWV